MARISRGFSVLELLVALTLTLVALGITSQLVLEAQRRLAYSGRSNLDGSVDLAYSQLRLDVRSSQSFDAVFGTTLFADGSTQALTLNGHVSGDVIAYLLVDGDLRRLVYPSDGFNPKGQRIVLQNVTRFRWRGRSEATRLLEVEITQNMAGSMTRLKAAGQREASDGRNITTRLLLRPRGVTSPGELIW